MKLNLNCNGPLFIFHINTCSLPKNMEDFDYLIKKKKTDPDLTGIIESRMIKNKSAINSINCWQ